MQKSTSSALLHCAEFGNSHQKETVVVLHGLFGNSKNLSSLCKALSRNARVIALDLPSHGKSPAVQDMSFLNQARKLVATLEALGVERFQIMGHSLGGKVAMSIALRYPEMVERLVVADIAPVTYSPGHVPYFEAMLSLPADTGSRAEADEHLSNWVDEPSLRQFFLQNLVKRGDAYVWRIPVQLLADQYDVMRGWKGIEGGKPYDGPALFIRGALSDYIQDDYLDSIAALFPNYQLAEIAGAGHWLHAEKPHEFNELVSVFFDKPSSK